MLGMRGSRRNVGIDVGCPKAQRSVNGVVIRMNQVMRRAGMPRVPGKDILGNGSSPHVLGKVTPAMARAQNRQCIEGCGIQVFRIRIKDLLHRCSIGIVPLLLVSGAVEQPVRSTQIGLLPLRGSLGKSPLQRRCQGLQHLPAPFRLLRLPDRVIVPHGLAPIGHRESRVDFPRSGKGFPGIRVFKTVQQQQSAKEFFLGFGSAGVVETGFTEVLGQRRQTGECYDHCDQT